MVVFWFGFCHLWPVEASKVGPPIGENGVRRPSEVDRGVVNRRFWLVRMVQSSSRLVYSSSEPCITKFRWSGGLKCPQFLPGKLESRVKNRRKFGPSEVVLVLKCSYKCSVALEIVHPR